jgi:hypothetical protein
MKKIVSKFWKSFKIIKIDVVIYQITNQDIFSFPDVEFQIQTELISRGNKKYFIEDKGVLVHQSFLFNTVFILRLIREKGPAIGDCFTHPAYRGKLIYPFVIHAIAKEVLQNAKNKAVFIVVNQDNLSSIKGIEKAGFKKCATIKAKRGLCFYFDKNIKYC